jgi:hypothetical protein
MVPYLGALLFVGLVVLGLALDVALLAATYQEVAFAADAGAEAGAAQMESSGAYAGSLRLDRSAAITAAGNAALSAHPRPGRSATATVDGNTVCVTVTDAYRPRVLGAVGVGVRSVTVRACAVPRSG